MAKELVTILLAVVVSVGVAFFVGCESEAQTGALIGTGVGALAGQAIGGDTESTLIGAAVGGGAGYVIGAERERQKTKSEIQQLREEVNTVTVNITNSNGSISQVKLRKQGTGYVGPKGEFYDHLPTEEELKPIYGF